ncbi:hypothetical protein AYX14_00633 [Cryptococcus neoformans]|nr:hypothetical protein AYX14_00633 [Cryptococcus neoformans var. grubii]OWZ74918.1 hypothetical protein C365_06585 [Cryptococcus neoformans var. grubii Bt85]OXM75961.1 hypothetical protein C364_06512 [Cryptococcus neoformans var. grubii Bt63]
MPCCVVTAFTNALWRDLPFGPMSCLNFSAITMVLSSRYIQRQYLLANKLFWVSTLTEADIAFVRAEILSHFAIFTAILLSILEFSPFTKDHSPFFSWFRLPILWLPLLQGSMSCKDELLFPQSWTSMIPQRGDEMNVKRLQREASCNKSEGFWMKAYKYVKKRDEAAQTSGEGSSIKIWEETFAKAWVKERKGSRLECSSASR